MEITEAALNLFPKLKMSRAIPVPGRLQNRPMMPVEAADEC
jgi:hypothetical protein